MARGGKYKKNISPPKSIKRKKNRNRARNAAEKAVAMDALVDRYKKGYARKR